MLLGSFLTPWRNVRTDDSGGRTPEGRIRAVVEVVEAIKDEVGADFPLTLRISGYERVPGGRDIAYGLALSYERHGRRAPAVRIYLELLPDERARRRLEGR